MFHAAVIGITETKFDNTVYDSVVTIDEYSIVRNDKNRKGVGVACYIKSDICYLRKTFLFDNLENIFIDLLFPMTKIISVGIFTSLQVRRDFQNKRVQNLNHLK